MTGREVDEFPIFNGDIVHGAITKMPKIILAGSTHELTNNVVKSWTFYVPSNRNGDVVSLAKMIHRYTNSILLLESIVAVTERNCNI